MKVEAIKFIHDYSITHGRASVRKNAAHLAKLLNTTIENVISHIPPVMDDDGPFVHDPVYDRKLESQVRQAARVIFTQKTMEQKSKAARAHKPARRATRSSAKSGDSNAQDPEPEPPRQLYFSYQTFAQLVDCTTRTLYNKVSTGQFPRPIKTAFGPRFTQEHLNSVVKTQTQPASARGRGRPRIAQTLGKGGVQ